MNYTIRPITPDEFPAFLRTDMAAGGDQPTPENLALWQGQMEYDRSIAALDGEQIVGTAGAYTLDLTLPGGATVPAPGVSWVGVLPTHRRRGLLREMMRYQLNDVRARSEPMAVLEASESRIYGRFGYGIATSMQYFELDARHAELRHLPEPPGRLRLVDAQTAATIYPGVYERFRPTQPGALTRSPVLWALVLDHPGPDAGMSGRFHVVYEAPGGEVEGIAAYRVKQDWEDGLSRNVVRILNSQFVAATPAARLALWRYLLNLDLIQIVRGVGFPVDEPLRWMLVDPRRMKPTALRDDLWVRLLDIPTSLAARSYSTTGRVVFEVADAFCPETAGRYELEAGPTGAECRRTTHEPDLALDVADLGAAYLGGVRFDTLRQAGRIEERTAGAAARADTLFRSDPAPHCGTPF